MYKVYEPNCEDDAFICGFWSAEMLAEFLPAILKDHPYILIEYYDE